MHTSLYQIICICDEESQQRFVTSLETNRRLGIQATIIGYANELLVDISLDIPLPYGPKWKMLEAIQTHSRETCAEFLCIFDEDILLTTFPLQALINCMNTYPYIDIIVPVQQEDNRHWNIFHKSTIDSPHILHSSQKGAFAYGCMLIRMDVFQKIDLSNIPHESLDDMAFHSTKTVLYNPWIVTHPFETPARMARKKRKLKDGFKDSTKV